MLKLFPSSASEDVGDIACVCVCVCVCWKLVENEEFCKMMKKPSVSLKDKEEIPGKKVLGKS